MKWIKCSKQMPDENQIVNIYGVFEGYEVDKQLTCVHPGYWTKH